MSLARGSNEQERAQLDEWLNESNEFITKSPRYDQLVEEVCVYFYKKTSTQVTEDTLNFIHRSLNELLRNKTSKEAMRKRLSADGEEDNDHSLEKMIHENEMIPREYDMDDMARTADSSDDELILGKDMIIESVKRDKPYDSSALYADKRPRETTMHM